LSGNKNLRRINSIIGIQLLLRICRPLTPPYVLFSTHSYSLVRSFSQQFKNTKTKQSFQAGSP